MNQIPNIEEDNVINTAILNLIFSGISIEQMGKIPDWLLENIEKNKTEFLKTQQLQLQKARQDGYNAGLADGDDYIPPLPEGKTLDDVIKDVWVDHSELDHLPDRPLNSERD